MIDHDANPAADSGAEGGSVREAVLAAFEQHGAATEDAPFRIEAPKSDDQPAEGGETDEQKAAAKARDEQGRFAKKAEDAKPAPADQNSPERAKETSDQDDASKVSAPASTPAGEPPKGWSAEAKAKWSSVPPEIQASVLKREQEINDGGRRWSEEKRHYEEMITPVRDLAQRHGVSERESITRLTNAQKSLDENPARFINWLAQSYKVDLAQLATNPGYQPAPVAQRVQTPDVTSIVDQVVSQRLEQRELNREIENFAKDPARTHFESVRDVMAHLIDSGKAETLADAYDQAVWVIPEVRQQILSEQQSRAAEDTRAQDQAKVTKARNTAVSIKGSPLTAPSSSAPKDFDTVHDAVMDAWQRHAG